MKHFIIGGKPIEITDSEMTALEIPEQVRFGGDVERILGILYRPASDTISFQCRVNFSKRRNGARTGPDIAEEMFDDQFPDKLTRRMYTSQVATLFDPPGLCSPVTVVMKHELGLIFLLEGEWDTAIPRESEFQDKSTKPSTTYERCKAIIRLFYDIGRLEFPRCLRPAECTSDDSPVLVVFCDASNTAYCCVLYYSWFLPSGVRDTRLICSKAKPVPKKAPLLSTPRAELMGALIGVRNAGAVLTHTTYSIESTLYLLDSTIVLSQICGQPYKFSTFVATRVSEIHERSKVEEFFHVDTKLNVADDASRGLHPTQMGPESRWQCGPEFMKSNIGDWPVKSAKDVAAAVGTDSDMDKRMEVRSCDPRMSIPSVNTLTVQTPSRLKAIVAFLLKLELDQPDKNDTWIKVRRRIARLVHFVHNLAKLCKSPKAKLPAKFMKLTRRDQAAWIREHDQFVPSETELEAAKMFLIQQGQQDLTAARIRSLQKLNPVKDEVGIWHVSGRTCHSSPPFLIPAGPLAEIVLRAFHVPHHSGAEATLAACREEYWILKGTVLAKRLTKNCAICCRLRLRSIQAIMAPLKDTQTKRY